MANNLVMTIPWGVVQYAKIFHHPKLVEVDALQRPEVRRVAINLETSWRWIILSLLLMEAETLQRPEERHVPPNLEITRMMWIVPPPRLVEVDALRCPEIRCVAINLDGIRI